VTRSASWALRWTVPGRPGLGDLAELGAVGPAVLAEHQPQQGLPVTKSATTRRAALVDICIEAKARQTAP
jgi:hypothetical protein